MAGYIGTKAVLLSTTAASVTGNADIGGDLTVGSNALFVDQSTGDISFYEDTGTTAKLFWDASAESLGIGTTSPVSSAGYSTLTLNGSTGGQLAFTESGVSNKFIYSDATNLHYRNNNTGSQLFYTSGTERMRIDASGNLLVNKTGLGGDVSGFIFNPSTLSSGANAYMFATNTRTDGAGYLVGLNRQGSDGDIIEFRKANSKVGTIGTVVGRMSVGSADTGVIFAGDIDAIYPANGTSARDNAIDLGTSGARFDDIYATNGTIQTSDRNEKQDIAELDEAERRVAVAAKGLLRKFRWKDAVAEKGDDARIHFGIIAQDLQAAFEAEGLDAGRYAMFISSTWWEADRVIPAVEAQDAVYETQLDEDGNEVQVLISDAVEAQPEQVVTDTYETQAEAPEGAVERTRLGVRYPELLAFIIGAM